MSLSPEQLKQHCQTIIGSRRIKNKIVVLCEGEIPKREGRLSPQTYGRMEKMPDANFYNACVPKYLREYRPQFFNCGDRKDVLDTYFTVLELHNQDSTNSYLSPEKLFAIVDLDLQPKTIDNYAFSDTEAIFCDLYHQGQVNANNAVNHRIWVTGLIHKEAYFLIPELQEVLNNSFLSPIYNNNPIILENIYIAMANGISSDPDLCDNLLRASARINYCSGLDCIEVDQLRDSWKAEFQNAQDDTRKNELIVALLTIKKAKNYWYQIHPATATEWTHSIQVYREQLSLEIGREFYAKQCRDIKYHIPFFLETLYEAD